MPQQWLANNLIDLLTLVSVVVGAVVAYRQWHHDQRWKRINAAFERVRSFGETPGTRNAMMILKSPNVEIPLWDPHCPPPGGPYIHVTWEEAKWALIPTSLDVDESPKTGAIRNSFEDLMDRMTQIEMFIAAGLLAEQDVKHLVEPWAKRLCSTSPVNDGGLSRNFRVYVEDEQKKAVQDLFTRYGFDIRGTLDSDRANFKSELEGWRNDRKLAGRPTL